MVKHFFIYSWIKERKGQDISEIVAFQEDPSMWFLIRVVNNHWLSIFWISKWPYISLFEILSRPRPMFTNNMSVTLPFETLDVLCVGGSYSIPNYVSTCYDWSDETTRATICLYVPQIFKDLSISFPSFKYLYIIYIANNWTYRICIDSL